MEKRARILLVDDHRLFRDGLKHIIAEDPEMVVVGEASNVKEALLALPSLKPDVILLDIERFRVATALKWPAPLAASCRRPRSLF